FRPGGRAWTSSVWSRQRGNPWPSEGKWKSIMTEKAMRTIAFVFARGGSKGVPRKNVRPLDGRPLIAHSIEVGLATPGVETVIVSTDDAEIAAVARAYGAEVPFLRPAELAQDSSPEWLAWRHA